MSAPRRGFPTFGQGVVVILISFGAVLATGYVGALVIAVLGKKHIDTVAGFGALLGAGLAAALVLAWASAVRREPIRILVVPKPVAAGPFGLALVATLGAEVVLSQVDIWLRRLIPPGPFFRDMMASLEGGPALVIVGVVVVSPLSEELIFRGVILRGFLENYGPRAAIVLSSLLFAFVHLNPWQGVGSFLGGCLLGWFVARTGSLLPAVAGHVMNNGIWLFTRRLDTKIPGLTAEGFQPSWLTALGMLVLAGGIVGFHRVARTARNPGTGTEMAS